MRQVLGVHNFIIHSFLFSAFLFSSEYNDSFRNSLSIPNRFLPLGLFHIVSYLTSHILEKSREVVSRCLPLGVFTETPSPASVSFTIRLSSSLFRDVGFAYTSDNSVVHHALSFQRGTTCRWCGGQLGVEAF